jgi:hypothetical protein
MKKLGFLLFLVLMLGVGAFAQGPVGDGSVYFVTYYSNAQAQGAPDAVVRMINDGDSSANSGNLWASYYVFDDSQELQECCSCFVSPDGVNSEDVNSDLLCNTLTGKASHKGVIKVVSSSTAGGTPYGDPTNNTPAPGLRGFATHIQRAAPDWKTGSTDGSGSFFVTEAPLADANLSASENSMLELLCKYAVILGSGRGTCTCTPDDHDF